MTIPKIKWVSLNSGAPDEGGNWRSLEGRFEISPKYRHTVNPDSYNLSDKTCGVARNFERVRDAKAYADELVRVEVAKDFIAFGLDKAS